MSSVAFDTLRFAKRLEEAGIPPAQATGVSFAFDQALSEILSQLATKQDLLLLRQELKSEIAILGQELKGDMAQLELRMTIKLGTMLAASVGMTTALVKLL